MSEKDGADHYPGRKLAGGGLCFDDQRCGGRPRRRPEPGKVERNPVSAGDLSAHSGRAASFIGAVVAAALYAWLGLWPFVIGVSCLATGYLCSWRRIRLKSIPVADLVSHVLMLAGLLFLAAYFTFGHSPAWQ